MKLVVTVEKIYYNTQDARRRILKTITKNFIDHVQVSWNSNGEMHFISYSKRPQITSKYS